MSFDPSKPCKTKDGREARIICVDAEGPEPIVALVKSHIGDEYIERYTPEGRVQPNSSNHDLINIPETRWVNIYEEYAGKVCNSRAQADDICDVDGRTACLQFQDGDGL